MEEAGLEYADLQAPIDDPDFRVRLVQFWRNGGEIEAAQVKPIIRGPAEPILVQPTLSQIIQIDRSRKFDPASFVGANWTIWRGPANGKGLEGDEDQDERSLALTEVDLSKVLFKSTLKARESSVNGEEKLRRLKAMNVIRLDAGVFQTFWEHREELPESWKKDENGNVRYIYFDGTILRDPCGNRCVLCLFFDDGRWHWDYNWLGGDWNAQRPSAVLASSLAL
jgi:hypothetical protein